MDLIIPTNTSEIKTGQYISYMENYKEGMTESEHLDLMFVSFTNATTSEGVSEKDKNEVCFLVVKAIETAGKMTNIVKLNGVEYGFIPNFDKITTGEFTNLSDYGKIDEREHALLKLDYELILYFLSICYRPVVKKLGKTYKIKRYKNTDNSELFKELPLSYVVGIEGFFLTLHEDLQIALKIYSEEAQVIKTNRNISKTMVFTLLFFLLVTMIILHFINY